MAAELIRPPDEGWRIRLEDGEWKVSLEELREWTRDRRVPFDAPVRSPLHRNWRRADNVQELETSWPDPLGLFDELYADAVLLVCAERQASASFLQRRLRIDFKRAERLIEAMESRGIVGPLLGVKPREVLAK